MRGMKKKRGRPNQTWDTELGQSLQTMGENMGGS